MDGGLGRLLVHSALRAVRSAELGDSVDAMDDLDTDVISRQAACSALHGFPSLVGWIC
ncbi:hypothetical protein AB0M11_29035 [Streptomyces sp. NPDC051987]|uniref:hypothetical protein n=1 Tax=Streptomyces sp. NPDC051987 TaxID=3155808 RepID=UPI0034136DB5